ncbi:hypothetical protein K474DRAFT_1624160 [Panus rudis PR-1116 ss-1]|nr:hypothetical protein K474DRAFT_1624160 [Panus rudis PR-1116 ss-1]
MSSDLADNAVGPVPAHNFLKNFMQPSATLPRRKRVSNRVFRTLKADLHEKLTLFVGTEKLCPNFTLRTDAKILDERSGIELRPEVCLFQGQDSESVVPAWSSMEFFIDIDPDETHDPFRAVFTSHAHNLRSGHDDSWKDTHERLLTYLTTQFSRQHRTFTFALVFFGRLVRFLRVDRAGVIVSSVVNYVENPHILVEFFWRYSHMSMAERGFDTCVVPASRAERRALIRAIFQYGQRVDSGQARRLPKILRTLSKEYPTYKVSVITTSTGEKSEYIIKRSFTNDRSLFGRGTRGFVALKLINGEVGPSSDDFSEHLVFLKDTWRVDQEGMEIEAEIYEDLEEHGVSHIPMVLAAGDVYSDYEKDDSPQQTLTQEWAAMAQSWNQRDICLTAHVHHCIVQKLLYPLETVANARELVQVIRDSLECIIEAYTKARTLHRDVSGNNVMLLDENGNARGVLNDWDSSCRLKGTRPDETSRIGTWRFMSIHALRKARRVHEIHDDLESLFWVLVFVALRHFKHEGRFDDEIFDQYYEDSMTLRGGASKITFLLFGQDGTFLCPALNTLIRDITQFWVDYYCLEAEDRTIEYNDMHDDIERNPSTLLAFFDTALASPDDAWVHDEWIPCHYPKSAAGQMSSPLGPISNPSTDNPESRTSTLLSPCSPSPSLKRPRHVDLDQTPPNLSLRKPKRRKEKSSGAQKQRRSGHRKVITQDR